MFLKILQNSQENICPSAFFNKALAQVSSYEFCEIFKSTFFHRTLLVTAFAQLFTKIINAFHLLSLLPKLFHTDAYSELSQTSKMGFLQKTAFDDQQISQEALS